MNLPPMTLPTMTPIWSAKAVYEELAETLRLEKTRALSRGPDHDVVMTAYLPGQQVAVSGIGYKDQNLILLWEERDDGTEDLYALHFSQVQIAFQIVAENSLDQKPAPHLLRGAQA